MSPLAAPASLVVVVVCASWFHARLLRGARRSLASPRPNAQRVALRLMHRPPARTTTEQWAALLDAIAADVRTGTALASAVDQGMAAAPWCRHARAPDADEAVVLQALDAARTLGGQVAPTLDAAAALLRERIAIRAEAAVHSAQARLSVRVLTLVPIAFCAWNLLTSSRFRDAWAGPVGRVCAALGAVLNLGGWVWMRRVVAGAGR